MHFDTIVVPRGAEARAVERGWPANRPPLLAVPAGTGAGRAVNDGRPIATALVLGLCGALAPGLHVGDAVVYGAIVSDDATIALDAPLASACAAGLCAPIVRAQTVSDVVGSVAAKREIRRVSASDAIDMEGAPLARALHARGVRVAMVRIVSDDAQGELPDLRDAYDARGSLRPLVLARAFATSPRRSIRFVRNALRALEALQTCAAKLAAAV